MPVSDSEARNEGLISRPRSPGSLSRALSLARSLSLALSIIFSALFVFLSLSLSLVRSLALSSLSLSLYLFVLQNSQFLFFFVLVIFLFFYTSPGMSLCLSLCRCCCLYTSNALNVSLSHMPQCLSLSTSLHKSLLPLLIGTQYIPTCLECRCLLICLCVTSLSVYMSLCIIIRLSLCILDYAAAFTRLGMTTLDRKPSVFPRLQHPSLTRGGQSRRA